MQTQISIDGGRLTAQRSGHYAGQLGPYWCGKDGVWVDVWLQEGFPAAAKVGVLRDDFIEPLWGVARWDSYVQTKKDGDVTAMWTQMGDVMIAKCAEMLALRKAFPMELSGLYAPEEMAQAENGRPPRAAQAKPATRPAPTSSTLRPPPGVPAADQSTGEIVVAEVVEQPAIAAAEPRTFIPANGSGDGAKATVAQLNKIRKLLKLPDDETAKRVGEILNRPVADLFELTEVEVITALASLEVAQ
jgi:hypothetical protein